MFNLKSVRKALSIYLETHEEGRSSEEGSVGVSTIGNSRSEIYDLAAAVTAA